MRDFRKLEIWIMSKDFVKEVSQLSSSFPENEKFGLVNQINRAAVSIPSNIAEGCNRATNKDFKRFIDIALGSSFELETQLIISKDLKYVSDANFLILIDKLAQIQKRLSSYRNYLIRNII